MFQALKEKLILLYTAITGLIIVIVMIILLVYTESILENKKKETFQNDLNTMIHKMQTENTFSHSWLSQMEEKNQLLIDIEDNGYNLTFPGAIITPTERKLLLKKLNSNALEEGIDKSTYPIFSNMVESNIYTLRGSKKEVYYGAVVILPTSSGWRSLSLLKYLSGYDSSIRNQRLLYLFLGLLGITGLYVVNRCFVTKMLKPIEENNEKQTSFIASASHELRSPLAVISANNSAIVSITPESYEFTNGIDRECKRMARLIDDMLLLASTDANTWILNKDLLQTDTLLIETYETYFAFCQQNGHPLYLDIPENELPSIHGDKERMQQVFSILIDNAVSYTKLNTKIILRGYLLNNQMCIEVEDHGAGIPEVHKKHIFDRFYRMDSARNDKKHFGLGLSIAKELIQQQGGRISIRDTVGGGTTFLLQFKV